MTRAGNWVQELLAPDGWRMTALYASDREWDRCYWTHRDTGDQRYWSFGWTQPGPDGWWQFYGFRVPRDPEMLVSTVLIP